jgi:hypothetical protein
MGNSLQNLFFLGGNNEGNWVFERDLTLNNVVSGL